jgi:hypothetical protein
MKKRALAFLIFSLLLPSFALADANLTGIPQKFLSKALKQYSIQSSATNVYYRQLSERIYNENQVLTDLLTFNFPLQKRLLQTGATDIFIKQMIIFSVLFVDPKEPILFQYDDICRKIERLRFELDNQ